MVAAPCELPRGCLSGVGLRCNRRQGRALVRMQILSSNAKMANDGIDAFIWPSQPSSMLRQPGLYPYDRSPAQPADLRKLTPCVQGYDLGKENGAIRSASHDERCVRCIRHQLNDPVRQIRAGSDGNLVCSCHKKQLDPEHDGPGESESFQVCSQQCMTASNYHAS
jgi:hypothetical protein